MFKEQFIKLCNEKGVAPTVVCQSIGLSNAAFSKWGDESIPRRATLQKLADYFGVSVDYLLGNEKQPEAPDLADTEMQDVIIYNRNGKTVRKRLPKAEYEAAIKMLDALGSDFPDV